jgi:hypothetical protein
MELPVPNKAGIAKLRAEMNGLNFALSIDTSESTWWISMIQQPSREWLRELVQKIEDFFSS